MKCIDTGIENTIKEFRIEPNLLDGLLNEFDKPFSNVEYVGIIGGISTRRRRLNYLFPKMRCLNFEVSQSSQFRDITYHFPHLKQLQLFLILDIELIDWTE